MEDDRGLKRTEEDRGGQRTEENKQLVSKVVKFQCTLHISAAQE